MILTPEEVVAIQEQAEREFPSECCGVVLVRGTERRILRFRNIQNERHARDPIANPRTAEQGYYADGRDVLQMERTIEQEKFALSVIYHSHPNAEAYFSATDHKQAVPRDDEGPLWPNATYVVFSVYKRQAKEWAAFRWSAATKSFVEIHREPVPGVLPSE